MTEEPGYWSKVGSARLSRRRTLAGLAAVGGAAVALSTVGCGSSKSTSQSAATPDLVTRSEDSSKVAKTGGTYRGITNADIGSVDPHLGTGELVTARTYPRLLQFVPGLNGAPPDGSVGPDLAESWEFAPDGSQFTIRLRSDLKWDSRSPTSARTVDAQDVVFSWDRFANFHPLRGTLANKAAKDAPIISMQATDTKTVVAKLAVFLPDMTLELARTRFLIMPREGDAAFDPKKDVRGASAWILDSYQPSQGFSFVKNPGWYRKDRPFVDRWDIPIVPEYATSLAQFRAGSIFEGGVKLQDVLPTKKDVPELAMYVDDWSTTVEPTIRFGLNSSDAPFWDQRVRQAISMLQDRDTWVKTFGAVDAFEAAGIKVETRWNTHGSVEGGVSPQDKNFGPNARYYTRDVAEAKKLLTAAGYANGFATDVIYRSNGQAVFSQYDAIVGMLAEGGIKGNIKIWDNLTEFTPKVRNGHGNWDGLAFDVGGASPSVASFLWRRYSSGGTVFAGFNPNGKDRSKGDPKVDDMTAKMIREADSTKRQALVDDFLRYMAETMYEVPAGGQARGFVLVWPAVKNMGVFRTIVPQIERDVNLWIDSSKRPIAAT